MSQVTNDGFFHIRGRNATFHKLQLPTGFVKMGQICSH